MKAALALLILLISTALFAQEARIPLESIRMPSDDLLHPELGHLSPEVAWRLQQDTMNPLDLSKLNPIENDVWKNNITHQNDPTLDQVNISSGESVKLIGVIASNSGVFRFNILPKSESNNKIYTILLEKTLHTSIMRRNLLRKLGYTVPKMKYLKNIKLSFKDSEEKCEFIKRKIPEATLGAPQRWITDDFEHCNPKNEEETNSDTKEENVSLEVTLKDVVGMEPSETDHYNLALGAPPKMLTSRVLRSLIIPYALLDMGESANKISWFVGREDNKEIILPHFTSANFNVTYDDALWTMRRFEKLTQADIEDVVTNAHFPKSVETLIVEKVKARYNSLMKLFKVAKEEYSFDSEITLGDGKELKDGKLLKIKWDGYAARFAHGDPDSPFQDFQYYIFSKLQSATIEGLMSRVNQELSLFDIGDSRLEYHQDQFEEGLNHFVETGEFLDFGVGTWVAPVVDGRIILNRDIVVGNYLGTDNMVQLADTVGVSINVGAHLGIEGLDYGASVSIRGPVAATISYSHLKPVKTLKATFKEPYLNMIVPLLKLGLKKDLAEIGNFEENFKPVNSNATTTADGSATSTPPLSTEEINNQKSAALEKIMEHINKNLGVGESLIVTKRLTPNLTGQVRFPIFQGLSGSVGAGTDMDIVRRLHLYRKDAETIQVYDDNGRGNGFSLSAGLNYYIPVIRLNSKNTFGKYKVRMHEINIALDVEENPSLYENALALVHLLKTGSAELLEAQEKPYVVSTKFHDKSTKFSFLFWRSKQLNKFSNFEVETPKGSKSHYMHLTKAGQTGLNYQAFVKDIGNYYIGKYLVGVSLSGDTWKNPAHTFYGTAETTMGRYETRLMGEQEDPLMRDMRNPFISLTTRKEGWTAKKSKIKKLMREINTRYGFVLFDNEAYNDAKSLKLYDLTLNVNLYSRAIDNIKKLSTRVIEKFSKRYTRERKWTPACDTRLRRGGLGRKQKLSAKCGNLSVLVREIKSCQKNISRMKNNKVIGNCLLDLAIKMREQLEFQDFKAVVGKDNYYLYGQVNGFRSDSEILNEPIRSNTEGKVGDRFWNGPVEAVLEKIGLQGGEFHGSWIREVL